MALFCKVYSVISCQKDNAQFAAAHHPVKTSLSLAVIIAVMGVFGCSDEKSPETQRAPFQEVEGGKNSKPIQHNNLEQHDTDLTAPPSRQVPKVLWHGSGGIGTPQMMATFAPFAKQLANAGFPERKIHQPIYPHGGFRQQVLPAAIAEFRKIVDSYPEDTQFDFIGYSMGHMVGLMVALESGLAGRVRKVIGVAGVAMGQHSKPLSCFLPMMCGDLFDLMVPYRNERLMHYYAQHEDSLNSFDKCSVYSDQDGMLNPPNAGAMDGGKNVNVPGVFHASASSNQQVFQAVVTTCYAGSLN